MVTVVSSKCFFESLAPSNRRIIAGQLLGPPGLWIGHGKPFASADAILTHANPCIDHKVDHTFVVSLGSMIVVAGEIRAMTNIEATLNIRSVVALPRAACEFAPQNIGRPSVAPPGRWIGRPKLLSSANCTWPGSFHMRSQVRAHGRGFGVPVGTERVPTQATIGTTANRGYPARSRFGPGSCQAAQLGGS